MLQNQKPSLFCIYDSITGYIKHFSISFYQRNYMEKLTVL